MVPSAVAVRVSVQFRPPQAPVEPVPGPSTCVLYVRPSQTSVASALPFVTTTSTLRRTPHPLQATGGGPWVAQDEEMPAAAFWSVVAQSGESTLEAAYDGTAAAVTANSAPANIVAVRARPRPIMHLPVNGSRAPHIFAAVPGKSCTPGFPPTWRRGRERHGADAQPPRPSRPPLAGAGRRAATDRRSSAR